MVKLDFPAEEPSSKDFKVWQSALSQLAPGGLLLLSIRLGNWVHIGHKLQPWRYCAASNRLFRYHDNDFMDIFPPYDNNPHGDM